MEEIVDLRRLAGWELDPLLLEETVEWQRDLDWDFGGSAELVRHYANERTLLGAGLVERGEVIGYGYSVVEGPKGLIGDLYIRPPWRNGESERQVFGALFDQLAAMPGVSRIESQLMLVAPGFAAGIAKHRAVDIYERVMMTLEAPVAWPERRMAGRFSLEPWQDRHLEAAAGVISLAYQGHVDSHINDQYRSLGGARRFLSNIIQFPGCGLFFRHATYVAFDVETGWMCGMVLASFVSTGVGHITQVCVTPNARGRGLGYELLRIAAETLRAHGAWRISLTVTASNREAIEVYEKCGFREVKRFCAYVWDRP